MKRILSTILVLACAHASHAEDYQKLADATPWAFSPDRASVFDSFTRFPMDYQVEISRPQNKLGTFNIRVLKDGKEVRSWQGHQHSVFTTSGDTLVVADFHPNRNGCGLVAFDLKNKKDLWQTELKGIGSIPHSRYSNRVNLEVVDGAVRVFSQESAGRYVEFVDAKTGKTVGHRIYPK